MQTPLAKWLARHGLGHLEPLLVAHGIAEDVLECLDEADLEKMGLSLGDRKRLLKAIGSVGLQGSRGDMRQLTIMFCDLVESTALCRRLGPQPWHEVVVAYQQAAGAVIERWGGVVAQYLGDGLLVYFGHPQAHEDAPERAVRAGMELVATVRDLHVPALDALPDRLAVRIGVHTGMIMIGDVGAGARREQLALGEAPSIAARLQGMAAPHAVLITDATRTLAGAHVVVEDFGRHELKGAGEARQVWRVQGISSTASRFDAVQRSGLTPLAGRGRELGLLADRWEMARQGRGQAVLVSGEAGIGKSRLLKELRGRLGNAGLEALQMQCSGHHVHRAFHPFIDHLERTLRFTRDLPPELRLDRLQAHAHGRAGLGDAQIALLAAMIGLPAAERFGLLVGDAARRERDTAAALLELLAAPAGQEPVLMLIEDVHWADPASLALLDLLVARAASCRMLLVATHRSDFRCTVEPAGHVTPLALSGLARTEVAALVARLAEDRPLAPEVAEQVITRTDGVPLFIEELTRSLLEGGSADAAPAGGGAGVPVTLRDSLMSRLDRLGPAKELAQVGAVVGREFSHGLVSALTDWPPSRLEDAVASLLRSGLISRQADADGDVYVFKHALVQDAAYDCLPPRRKRELHAAVVDALEQRPSSSAGAQPETLARHASAAGLARRAIGHWRRAGEQALQRLSLQEAVAHLRSAIADAARLTDVQERRSTEMHLHASLGAVHMLGQGWASPQVAQAYERAHELARSLDHVEGAVWPLWGVCIFHLVQGRTEQAWSIGQRVLTLARQAGSRQVWLVANMLHTQLCLYSGRLAEVQGHVDQVEHRYSDPQDRELIALYSTDLKLVSMVHGSQARWIQGQHDQDAQALCEAQERYGASLGHPYSMAWVLTWGAMSYLHRGQAQALLDRVQEGLRLARRHGFAYVLGMGAFAEGWARFRLGKVEAGLDGMEQGLKAFQATGAGIAVPFFQALLAEAMGQAGRTGDGLVLVDDAMARTLRGGERWHLAELHRIRGGLLAGGGEPDLEGAREALQQAVAVAHEQGAGAWLGRAQADQACLPQG